MQRTRILPLFVAAFGCLIMTVSVGCQCTRLTDCYSNIIDDVSDHQGCLDDCYCAGFDLTRIGYSDWRACPWNRVWCRKCAKKDNWNCEAYHAGAYGPVYSSFPSETAFQETAQEPPVPAPEPPVPAPEPEPVDLLPLDSSE